MRPYITVTKIPNFDPTNLPYWNIYENEGKANSIQVGGTMAGEFTAGLSGGQRKLLLFELIRQRVKSHTDLLIVLDEPFAGVTDDFVPFIVERLQEMRQTHNILLVTNDHVETLTKMADNTITVSAIDRTSVKINDRDKVDRNKAIAALSVGDHYVYDASSADFKFFMDVEVYRSSQILGVTIFTVFAFSMILLSFWGSDESSAALVLVAAGIIAFFSINPYLLSLVEWRIYMREEAEALVHSSKGMNKFMKTNVTLVLIVIISLLEYGCINAVVSGLEDIKFWVGMLFDSASMTFPVIALGIYTNLPFQLVQILGFLPFLFMIFFSTTFSPGSGVKGIKALRYLFSRFYFWCMVPGVQDDMEGCPADNVNLLYLILSALLGVFLFMIVDVGVRLNKRHVKKKNSLKLSSMMDNEFQELMVELYGEKGLRRFQHMSSTHHSQTGKTSEHEDINVENNEINVPVAKEGRSRSNTMTEIDL